MIEILKIYSKALGELKWKAIIICFIIGLSGLLEGLSLAVMVPILETGLSGVDLKNAINYIVLFFVLGLTSAVIKIIADKLLLRIRTQLENQLRRKMTELLFKMSWVQFITMRTGDISKAMVMEGLQTATGVYVLLQGLGASLISVAFIAIAFYMSPVLTIIVLLFVGFIGIGYRTISKKASAKADQLSKEASEIGDHVSSIFGNLKFFKGTGLSNKATQWAYKTYNNYEEAYYGSQIYGYIMRFVFEAGGILMISLYLFYSILYSSDTLGQSLVFLALFYRLAPRLFQIQDSLYQATIYSAWYKSWEDRCRYVQKYLVPETSGDTPIFRKEIKIENVFFKFPDQEEHTLLDIDFTILKGKCVAIVGESGSGKSTLLDIMTGLLQPSSGEVLLDGVNYNKVDIEAWRKRIGLVLQENPIFHASILENITWGFEQADNDMAEKCAVQAHAWEFIQKLPYGMETVVGEKGGRLSGGQRQRIALARALYRNPAVLMLDEATSALDGESEKNIQESLLNIKGNCTIIMVSHRLETVKIADEIVVLQNGKIVESGSWDELVSKQCGAFKRMAQMQGYEK